MLQKASMPGVPNLGPTDVLGLHLPEAFTTTSAGQDFWELKSKNIWGPKVEDHCSMPYPAIKQQPAPVMQGPLCFLQSLKASLYLEGGSHLNT